MKKDYNKGVDKRMTDTVNMVDFFDNQPIGRQDVNMSNYLRGFNTTKSPIVLETEMSKALVFITRPMLDLSTFNMYGSTKSYKILNKRDGIHRYVRMMLDPRLAYADGNKPGLHSALVDNENPFIPVMSNLIDKLSGWPDEVMGTFTSTPGIRKEEFSMIDGISETNKVFQLDAVFKNTKGEPIRELMQTWFHYGGDVSEGIVQPRYMHIPRRDMNYSTRIYVLVLDQFRRMVKKIAMIGGGFPINNAVGSDFDYDGKTSMIMKKEFTVRFQCMGARYNEPFVVDQFNKTVAITSRGARNLIMGKPSELIEIPRSILSFFKWAALPLIKKNLSLGWFVNRDYFNARYEQMTKIRKELNQ